MTNDSTDLIEDQALDWVIRQRDPAFDDWEPFTAWLSADPRHADVYQAMAVADADMAEIVARPMPRPLPVKPAPAPVRGVGRRRWLGGALAASLVAAFGIGVLVPRSDPYVIETAPGQHRTIALKDGSRIDLNGGTRMTLDRNDGRIAVLERGEAAFTVIHNERDPFEVRVGDALLRDVGTAFNVVRTGGVTAVQVSEGAVVYNPDNEAVTLPAGRTLRADDDGTRLVVGEIQPGLIAAWREGRLVYDGAPLADVAADLSRNLGIPIATAPDVAARPIRAVITLDRDQDAVMRRLGPLLDVEARRAGRGWMLTARSP